MRSDELRSRIEELVFDIDFCFNGVWGSVCPFSSTNISIAYNGEEITVDSVDEAMTVPFFDGLSLEEIAEELAF